MMLAHVIVLAHVTVLGPVMVLAVSPITVLACLLVLARVMVLHFFGVIPYMFYVNPYLDASQCYGVCRILMFSVNPFYGVGPHDSFNPCYVFSC